MRAISARWAFIAAVLTKGRTSPAATPRAGQTAPNRPFRTDRAEQIGPLIAGIAGRAGAAAARGPVAGEGSLLTHARFILEPDVKRLVPCPRRDRVGYRFGEVF